MTLSQLGWIIFTIIVPSIPEQIFYMFFTLFLLGKADVIKINANNIKRILVPSVIVSIISVMLRTYAPFLAESGLALFIGIIITWISIFLTYRITNIREVLKTLACTILSFIFGLLFQFSYIPLLLYGTNTGVEEISKPGIMPFIWTLPEMAMIFSFISFINVRSSIHNKVNFITVLSRNRIVMTVTIILLLFNIAFLAVMVKLVCFDKILLNLAFINQLFIIVIIAVFPIINVSLILILIYSNYYRETIRVLLSKDRLNTLVNILGVYAEEKKYEKIDNIISELNKQVHYM